MRPRLPVAPLWPTTRLWPTAPRVPAARLVSRWRSTITGAEMAAAHRSQAIVPNDWFFGSKTTATAPAAEEVPLGPATMPETEAATPPRE